MLLLMLTVKKDAGRFHIEIERHDLSLENLDQSPAMAEIMRHIETRWSKKRSIEAE